MYASKILGYNAPKGNFFFMYCLMYCQNLKLREYTTLKKVPYLNIKKGKKTNIQVSYVAHSLMYRCCLVVVWIMHDCFANSIIFRWLNAIVFSALYSFDFKYITLFSSFFFFCFRPQSFVNKKQELKLLFHNYLIIYE